MALSKINTNSIADDAVTTAKVNPAQTDITSVGTLTSFASTGIDDNADATAMTIDSSGRVFKSVMPRFSVYRGGSEQYVNTSNMASVGVAIDWSTAEVNNGGAGFDLSNNRFQAPATGSFRFDFSILSIKNFVSSSELNSFFRRHSLAVEISKFLKSVTLLYYLWHNKKARFTIWGIF